MSKQINIGGRLHSTEVGNVSVGANEVLDDTKGKKQNVINSETDAELLRLDQSKQNNLTFDNTPTENSTNPVTSGGVYAANITLHELIEAILVLIPSAASALNQLADKAFVNSSVSTATATFRGTYNVVTDLELAYDATHEQIATKLGQVIATADNNDYAFVQVPVSATSTDIRRTERYKFNGTVWGYEYDLNTSGFTAAQWEAINSAITAVLVQKLAALPTAQELAAALLGKQDVLTFDNVPTTDSSNPVKSGGVKSAINNEKVARENADTGLGNRITAIENVIPSSASSSNKLVDNSAMSYAIGVVTALIGQMDATFNLTTTDGHITLHVTQVDGVITSVQVQSSDIASAAALTLVTNRVTTAEGDITSLTGRVSTNETDIANLQQLYNNLQQSKPEPVTALPSTGQQQGVIYRLAGTTSYSDYMWNGSTWVLMATYNNAIDPRPKKASQNLVTSGGVFDNMGALDVSELNATENPHTLAQYNDLPAALAAIPTDYQKGGMSIKFVQSSDNKYVQYHYMGTAITGNPNPFLDTANWQGVDEEPTAGSDNLVKSGGVYKSFDCPAFNAETTLGHMIKELYLTGLDDNLQYKIQVFGKYDNRQTIVIYQGDTAVAQSDTVLGYDGVAEVWQLNNSGISGYVVYDLSPMSGIVTEYTNYIKNKEVQTLTENSLIYTFLKNKELSDAINPEIGTIQSDIESIHNLVEPIENNIINITEATIGWYNSDTSFYTVGYNKPFEKDSVIERIELGYNVTGLSVGMSMDVVYGLIDQRGWFIKDGELPCVISAINGNVITLLPSVKKTIKAGRMIVVNCGEKWDICGTVPPTSITEEYGALIHVNLNNLPTGVTQRTDIALCNYRVYVTEVDSIFATDYDLNVLDEKVSQVSEAVATSKVFVDSVTGDRYLLVVTNGNLVLRLLQLDNILVLGNSMTEHSDSPGIWWGNGRGMAASVNSTQYTSLIAAKTGAQITKGNYAQFEIGYSPSYDFASNMPISNGDSYNLVIVQLFENAAYNDTMQASWEALYDYIRTQCPNAQIIQVIGWYEQQKANAVQAAAAAKGVTILNCDTEVSLGKYTLGDYVTGYDGSYHAIENVGVANHPSDIGMFGIAKKVLGLYMIDADDAMKNITIGGISGGTIEVPYAKWVVGGVVNVRVTSGTINSIVVNNGSVNVTKQDNTHFTFIMPNEDVVITA